MTKVFYGLEGKEEEVTERVLSLTPSQTREPYNILFGDPCPGREKRLRIYRAGRNYYFREDSPLDLSFLFDDYSSFDWITYVLNYPELSFIKNEVDAIAHLEGYGKREERLLSSLSARNGKIYLLTQGRLKLVSLFYTLFLGHYTGREVILIGEFPPDLDITTLRELLEREEVKVNLTLEEQVEEEREEFNWRSDNLIDLLLSLRSSPPQVFLSDPLPSSQHASFFSIEEKLYPLLAKFLSPLPSLDYSICSFEGVEGEVLPLYFSFLENKEKWERSEDLVTLSRVKKFFGMESSLFNRSLAKLRKALGRPSYLLTEKVNSYFLERI